MAEAPVTVTCECGEIVLGTMEDHLYESHRAKSYVYVCPHCSVEFIREGDLGIHLRHIEGQIGLNPARFF